jgi:ribonuclease E
MDEATAEATTVIAPAVDASAVQGGGVADTSPVAPEAPVSAPAKQHGVTPAGASPVRSAPSSAVASMPRHTIASAMAAAAAADPIPAASATEPFALSGSSAAAAGSASVPQQLPATAAAAAPLAGDAVGAVEPTARTWVIGSRLPTAESLPFSPELSRMLLASLHQVVADCTVASEPSLSVNDVRDIDEMYAEFTGSV